MDMQSKRGKALSVVTAATLAASLGVPALAVADEANAGTQAVDAQATGQDRANVVDEMLAGQSEAAVLPAPQDGVITLTEDVAVDTKTMNELIAAHKNLTINLAGYTLTHKDGASIEVKDGNTLTFKGGTFVSMNMPHPTKAVLNIRTGSAVSVEGATIVTSATALYPQGDAASVVVRDSKIYCGVYGVGTNAATTDNYNVKIELVNSEFTAGVSGGDNAPVMVNVPCSLVMDGCTVNGTRQALIVRGGTADIKNSKLNLKATTGLIPAEYGVATGAALYGNKGQHLNANWGSGNEVPMAALVVGNRSDSYKYPTNVSMVGTEVNAPEGYTAVYPYSSGEEGREVDFTYDASSKINGEIAKPEGSHAVVSTAVAEVGGKPYASLAAAVAAAADGATVTLLDDVVCDENLSVTNKLVIDLAGHVVTTNVPSDFIVLDDRAAKLTIKDSGADGKIVATKADPVVRVNAGTLDFQGGTIAPLGTWLSGGKPYGADGVRVFGSTDPKSESYSNVIVGKDATIACTNDGNVGAGYAVNINRTEEQQNHAFGITVQMDGTTVNAGMYLNGMIVDTEGNVPVINVGPTAKLDGMIYAAGYAEWNIAGGEIEDTTGMEIRAGVLNVTGGSITGTGTPTQVDANGNGSTTEGAGIAVAQHGTKLPIEVNISGGTITGYTAFYESNPQKNPADDIARVKLNITGGTFNVANGGVNAIYSEDCKGFIAGGSFASDPSVYAASGYVTAPSNGKWVVSKYTAPVPPTPEQPEGEVEQRPDGSTVTTVTKPDGSQAVTTEAADGSQSVVSKDDKGNVTSAEATVSDKAASDGAATLPLDPVKPAADAEKAPAIEVDMPASATEKAPVVVTVPVDVDEPDYGIVVFAVDADGNETVLPKSGVDADGNVVFEATGDVTIKVVDAASAFPDVAGTWYGKQGVADFVSARGILTGIPQADGTLRFAGDAATTRAMFVTMLHRVEACPDAPDAGFADAEGMWFEDAAAWGEATGVVDGYGGSVFGGEDLVTREQMAVFLMRYAEHLGLDVSKRADLAEFPDGAETSTWASQAMSWAVAEGLFSGRDGQLDPTEGATRAEASAVVMRFVNGLYA